MKKSLIQCLIEASKYVKKHLKTTGAKGLLITVALASTISMSGCVTEELIHDLFTNGKIEETATIGDGFEDETLSPDSLEADTIAEEQPLEKETLEDVADTLPEETTPEESTKKKETTLDEETIAEETTIQEEIVDEKSLSLSTINNYLTKYYNANKFDVNYRPAITKLLSQNYADNTYHISFLGQSNASKSTNNMYVADIQNKSVINFETYYCVYPGKSVNAYCNMEAVNKGDLYEYDLVVIRGDKTSHQTITASSELTKAQLMTEAILVLENEVNLSK